MAKEKTKIVQLEGVTTLTNKQLAEHLKALCAEMTGLPSLAFKLTQKPIVSEAQSPKK